jgi:uncharacterized OB-fold protein
VNQQPIAAGLFRTSPALKLIGGRHRESGHVVFPLPGDDADYEPIELPDRGSLWSYTVQRFEPKSPPYHGDAPFAPFAVGYVELPGALIVESRLIDVRFDELRVGLPMQLTMFPLRSDGSGSELMMFGFRPSAEVRA